MARGRKDIAEDGKRTRFSKDNQPKNAGRKPRLYTILKKDEPALTRSEYNRNCIAMLMADMEEFKAIAQDENAPMYIKIIANAIKEDLMTGQSKTLQQIIEANFGKAEQKISTEVSFSDFLKKASLAHGIKTEEDEQ